MIFFPKTGNKEWLSAFTTCFEFVLEVTGSNIMQKILNCNKIKCIYIMKLLFTDDLIKESRKKLLELKSDLSTS